MAQGLTKRFWKQVTVTEHADGFGVALDERDVRTPAKAPLIVPTRALAQAISKEWDAQTGKIDPAAMPMTRTANSAIDKVVLQRAGVVEMLAAYGDADLLCYRAEAPSELVARQTGIWDPLLQWASDDLGLGLTVQTGVMHRPQSPQHKARMHELVDQFPAFELAAFHDLVTISGSLVIALAVSLDQQPVPQLWAASRVDENWQIEQWGKDNDDSAKTEMKRCAFEDAAKFFHLSKII